MGALLKFLLILFLIGYLINKFSSFLIRRALKTFGITPPQKEKRTRRRKKGIQVEYVPEEEQEDRRRSKNFRGGDYVDFEEVK
ncbi:hypothetical protein [uncultured Microscilla sp.]|uniref:hypothetical protein n=1 Tax=uncultured Microscilla sp. TaxID=432653 RepID=UPI00261E5499|nr:hypothetical protein [uncultured Microscilla sp.]